MRFSEKQQERIIAILFRRYSDAREEGAAGYNAKTLVEIEEALNEDDRTPERKAADESFESMMRSFDETLLQMRQTHEALKEASEWMKGTKT